jgi:hypothetical protein
MNAAPSYSGAVMRSSASKQSKDFDLFNLDGDLTPLDLARRDRTIPRNPVDFSSAAMMESSQSSQATVAYEGSSQTPEVVKGQAGYPGYADDELTPPYIRRGLVESI